MSCPLKSKCAAENCKNFFELTGEFKNGICCKQFKKKVVKLSPEYYKKVWDNNKNDS